MRPAYILLIFIVLGILGTIYFLLGRFYFQLGEVDTGHSWIALLFGAVMATLLIGTFITIAVKGRKRAAHDRDDQGP